MLSHIGNREVYRLCIFLRNGEGGSEMIDCRMMVWLWWSDSIAYCKRASRSRLQTPKSPAVALKLLLNCHHRLSPSSYCSMVITTCRPQATAQWSSHAVALNLLLNGHLRLSPFKLLLNGHHRLSPSSYCSMVISACCPQATAQWSSQAVALKLLLNGHLRLSPSSNC